MAHESFEDEVIAEKLRNHFISVKVDREERPDVDHIYMSACQAMLGSGGWPLTVIMTPEHKPFFAATYLPRHTRRNVLGLTELLGLTANKWKNERESLEAFSAHVTDVLSRSEGGKEYEGSNEALVDRAFATLKKSFDPEHGGFGTAPKFPSPHNILFLLQYHEMTGDHSALNMSEKTLEQMYRGGIFDHIGFGFSRYSTDESWLAPHFEKMLYDNALLVMAYTAAYRASSNELHKSIAEKTLHYVKRELTSDEGGFFCAQDADSDGIEGKYYLFTPKEIVEILGEPDGWAFNKHFDITSFGNFEGKNIPNLLSGHDADGNIDKHLPAIYEYRKKRAMLHKDDKILTSWNGLMIAALAGAYATFDEPRYLEAARAAVEFVDKNLSDDDVVFTSWRDGKRSKHGFLEDYAFYIFGLIELYRVTFDRAYLRRAEKLTKKCIEDFRDSEGGFFLYGKNSEQLITCPKETYDGATPSGNSVMAYNLFMLARILRCETMQAYANEQFDYMLGQASAYPYGNCFFMYALTTLMHPPKEIVCVLKSADELGDAAKKLDKNAVVTIFEGENGEYKLKDGLTTYYICDNGRCLPPTVEP